jgi:dTDP-4-amino-4,6-dideoxygalactose transaminase
MAALLLDVGPADEVIVPSFTFVSSANAFALRGATIIFADSEKDTPNVSVDDILKKVTEKTKAIVVVHYAGIPVDVSKILKETNHCIPVVEDCAHAITSVDPRSGDFVGKAGCLSTFSFHETKNVGIGEGGLLVVNDSNLWNRAQIVREKGTNRVDFRAGREAFYTWVDLGSSYLMSEVDAASLLGALKNIDRIQEKRLQIWEAYDKEIIASPRIFKKPTKEQMRANAHMYFLDFSSSLIRSEFCKAMKAENILVATHYLPLDTSPFILKMRANKSFPSSCEPCYQAAVWSKSLVRLPLFEDLNEKELRRVITAVNMFSPSVHMELANECYWEDIRKIRNDNKECFTHAGEIGREEHWAFMKEHSRTYRVAVQDKKMCRICWPRQ